MSKAIPAQIERDFQEGKAQYRTFQTGVGGQSILPVDPNAYIIIFGYDYSPAGGGLVYTETVDAEGNGIAAAELLPFGTQQISFYTGNDFYPFIHNIPFGFGNVGGAFITAPTRSFLTVSPVERQLYIVASRDVAITVGLILKFDPITANAIPVTSRTPQGLTYGGDVQTPATQTDFSTLSIGGPVQFMQPSLRDYNDFGFGLLPGNASDQAFAKPDNNNGLIEPSSYITNVLGLAPNAAHNYFLNIHYALYTAATPEQL